MTAFVAGQVWVYHTRPGEESSRVVICRVEHDARLGEIVHIQLTGLRMRNSRAPGGFSDQIGHMPCSAEALRSSVVRLESTSDTLSDFADGYDQWRAAFDQRRAGIWMMPLSEAIAVLESAMD